MDGINKKKILEFCGFEQVSKEYMENCSDGYINTNIIYGDCDTITIEKPNIYSLDWQKEYLLPKIKYPTSVYLGLTAVAEINYGYNLKRQGVHTDPAKAILLVVMEMLNGKD